MFLTYVERGDTVLYSVSNIMTLLQKIVKLCHIRYGRGQKVNTTFGDGVRHRKTQTVERQHVPVAPVSPSVPVDP